MSCLRTTIQGRSCTTSTIRRCTSSGCGHRLPSSGSTRTGFPAPLALHSTLELEHYDYTRPGGLLEIDNRKDDPAAIPLLVALLTDVLPNELRAPLPRRFVPAQTIATDEYLGYVDLLNAITTIDDTVAVLPTVVGDV